MQLTLTHPELAIIIAHIKYPPTYPDVGPELDVTEHPDSPESTLDVEADKALILNAVKNTIEENLGMAMVFQVVTELKEAAEDILRERFKVKEAERQRLIAIEEEKEMAKFRGTKVTPESFKEWMAKFRKEMEEAKKERERLKEEEEKGTRKAVAIKGPNEKRLTGKQLFQRGLANVVEDDADGDEPDVGSLKIEA